MPQRLPTLWLAAVLWAGCAAAWPAPVDEAIGQWRSDVVRVRALAENDVPQAYVQALTLQSTLPRTAQPTDRVKALNLLARAETYLGRTDDAARHADEAFQLASAIGDRAGQAESDLNVSLNSINQGRLDALVTATTRSVSEVEGTDRIDLLSEALLRTAVMYRRFEQLDESVAVAVQAMEIAKRSKMPLALAYAHQALAVAFDQSYRFAEAREHYAQMREQARAAHSRMIEGFAVAALARARTAAGDVAVGEAMNREAVEIFRVVGAPFAYSFGLYGLAENLRLQGRPRDAMVPLAESLAVYAEHPNRIGVWFTLNERSAAYQALGDAAAARADAEQAYAIAKDLGLAIYTSGSALRLASIAASNGDYRRAYDLSVEAHDMMAKATREKASARIVQLTTRYETESKQREIDALTRRNEQQTSELRQHELQQRWLWTVLAASGVLLAATALFLLRLRRTREDIRALNTGLERRVQERTAELRQQALYLRTLLDMLPMWTWFKDTQGRYLVTNQAHAQGRGRAAPEMVGKSDFELLPPALARAYDVDDAEVMASRGRKTVEEAIEDASGRVWMETFKAAVIDEDGSVLGTVGVARNISERKATEAARERALAEAERLARLRSEFLAQMSHELRTPLNGILGFAQLLRNDSSLGERQRRGVNIIQESGQHLLALINDVLDLARVDAGKLQLSPGPVDVRLFLQVVADIVRVKADEKGLAFALDASNDLPATVQADEMRVRQVLLNLLSNAVKFTDRGSVRLKVARLPPASTQGSHVLVRFEVVDSGIGMDADQLERLFQPFEQLGDVRRRAGGTGLGLAISRELVRLMGADIQVSSEPGRGTRFWFDLPLPVAAQQGTAALQRGAPEAYVGTRRRVLVVDDTAAARVLLDDLLTPLGFDVFEASDGKEGLAKAAALRPDLVIMDLSMPNVDGLEAMRRLSADPALSSIPVIATSANASAATARQCREAGARRFVLKPMDHGVLLAAMGELLELQWVLAPPSPPRPADERAAASHDAIELPPPDELEVLRRLVRVGSMRDIRLRAEHLRALDPRYAAFADRLRMLAEGYHSRAIAELVREPS